MRRRLVIWLVRTAIVVPCFFALLWGGLLCYFRYVDDVAEKVRHDVLKQEVTQGGHFLPYDQIPHMYIRAVVATEDRSFFSNIGIDLIGMGRALYVDVRQNAIAQGGSTITEQLVKNALLSPQRSPISTLLEPLYAIGLYDTMSKQETFALYANDIYFGQGAYGLYNAAETYFAKSPSLLNDGELTMLAGLPNAPSAYDPFYAMSLARQRQQLVLMNMINAGMLTSSQANRIFGEPIRLKQGN